MSLSSPSWALVTDSRRIMATSGSGGLRVSAPGKVLLTGGYLILEEKFSGLVLATSARFHSTISRRRVEGSAGDAETDVQLRIRVESPQFHQVIVAYAVRVEDDRLDFFVADESDRNAYIEETLLCALNGAVGLNASAFHSICTALRANGEELHVRLEADNAFYSQVTRLRQAGKELSRRSLAELPDFMPPVLEGDASSGKTSIAKTGLGSSAALVTSLVGAILQFFLQHETASKNQECVVLDLIHNLAQLSHCFVQRKIGSGFDVSAASYGTQRYSRFPPSMLDAFTIRDGLKPIVIADCIRNDVLWKRSNRVQPFSFPANFHLLMGDVSTGSATVSMVKQVLQWKKSNPAESARVIGRLAEANDAVERSFRALDVLSAANPTEFDHTCAEMAQRTAQQWIMVDPTVGAALLELRNHYQDVRQCFREMGELAGVPIEPREQTALIDATLSVPGVLFAGVPGAGGYDALFVLTLDGSTLDRVEKVWLEWANSHPDTVICPLLCDVAPSSGSALSVEWF